MKMARLSGWMMLLLAAGLFQACDSSTDVDALAESAATVELDISYEYDALDRLVAVYYNNGDVERYSYDEAGNILTVQRTKAVP